MTPGALDMKELKRHLFALATMVFGGSTALASVFAMNSFSQAPPAEEKGPAADFQVEKQKEPPKQQKKPEKRREVKTSSAPRAPAPELGSALGGIDFSLPGFATANFGQLGEKLLGDTSKHTTMTADTVDTKPQPRNRPAAAYPDKARQKGITGHVTVRMKVGVSGRVESVRVIDAKPSGVFEEAAVAAVKQWEFDPAVYQGSPVATLVDQIVRFNLSH